MKISRKKSSFKKILKTGEINEHQILKYLLKTLESLAQQFLPKQVWNKYQQIKNKVQNATGVQVNTGPKPINDSQINHIKPSITKLDTFPKHQIDKTEQNYQHFQTIFINQLACLRYCIIEMKKMIEKKQKYWNDPEFGPTNQDKQGINSIYAFINQIPPGMPISKQITWMKPQQWIETLENQGLQKFQNKQYKFFDEGASANDVKQGNIGDCWFISSLSIIAQNDQYLRGKFQPSLVKQDNIEQIFNGVWPPIFQWLDSKLFQLEYGIYVHKYFKNQKPVYVVIDSYLPINKETKNMLFGKCVSKKQFWVNLIEKSYAKLHFCYSNLISGDISQGLKDLTGFVPIKKKLPKKFTIQEKEQLWKYLLQSHRQGSLMGCSAQGSTQGAIKSQEGQYTGILSGHAYAIINVFQIAKSDRDKKRNTSRLLIIRNPWAEGEWLLKWSQQADHINYLKQRLPLIEKVIENQGEQYKKMGRQLPQQYLLQNGKAKQDGMFVMRFKDFRIKVIG